MTYISRGSLLVVLMLLAPPAALTAQGSTPLSPGTRVRVTVAPMPTAKGTVVESSDRSFRFVPEKSSDTITVEYAKVTELDVSRGFTHRVAHHAGLGSAAGLVVGGIVGAARHANFPKTANGGAGGCSAVDADCIHNGGNPPEDPTGLDAKRTAKGAAIGAAAGFVAGMVVGKILKSEVWEKLPSERYGVHVAVFPTVNGHEGVALQFRIAM